MGVPVITLPGKTFAGRHSLSHLSNVGLTETWSQDVADYVELAVGLRTTCRGWRNGGEVGQAPLALVRRTALRRT